MEHRWTLQRWVAEAEGNLLAWQEPTVELSAGSLVPTEPDAEQRALIRITLRAQIYTLRKVLGEEVKAEEYECENHRDLQRIREEAAALPID